MTLVGNPFSGILATGLLVASLVLAGCDRGSAQRDFEADAALPPAGITHTDESGNVIGDPDEDDWRTAPRFSGVTIHPAFPNPVPDGFTGQVQVDVIVPFTSAIAGGLELIIYDPRHPRSGLLAHVPANELFEVNSLRFTRGMIPVALTTASAPGFYRLFVQDGAGQLISYGDLCVQPYPCDQF